MAKEAVSNEPSKAHVQDAVHAIEKLDSDLLAEKMAYMARCKKLRQMKSEHYDHASDQGISKKLLKKKIKERDLHRKADRLTQDLEDDERSEYEMLSEKLGDFGNLPLGAAALSKAGNQHAGA